VIVPVPVAATLKLAVCPAMTLRLEGCVVIESAAMPVPLRETVRGEFAASLSTAMLPVTLPSTCGANWTWNAWFCPAAMETEDIPPTTLKPAPVIVAWEIITGAVPVLVRVNAWVPEAPVFTFPKVMLVALAASAPEEPVFGFVVFACVPALVKPAQPESVKQMMRVVSMATKVSGTR
jgi:hypothetical protein